MAKAGKFTANFNLIGFKPTDSLPRLIRMYMILKFRERALIAAMKNAAQPMADRMAALAPVRTGQLSRSYASSKLKKVPPGILGIRVGAVSGLGVFEGDTFGKAGWRDHWAELGTVNHPGKPHVQPAIKQTIGAYRIQLRKNLAGILKNLNRI
jgi:HK97 gp10 family phage protein